MRSNLVGAIRIVGISIFVGVALSRVALAEQAKVKSISHVVVLDSKGKSIGETIGGIGLHYVSETAGGRALRPTVLLRVEQYLAAVNVARDRFFGGNLYFQSEDCTGTPWLLVEILGGFFPPPLLPHSAIGPPGQTLYVQIPSAAPLSITAKSRFLEGLVCENVNVSLEAVPAQPLVDLLTVFTPPFTLRAAP